MDRADLPELLEDPSLSEEVVAHAYIDLARTQRFLGNYAAMISKLRESEPRRVLDIGCGQGALLAEIHKKLGVEVVGFDLRPCPGAAVPIVAGNAAIDPLPEADTAISVCLMHHLSEEDAVSLIRNASKSCRRLILLDLVRHWIPLALFRVFVSPFLHPINAADGITSVKRAYTPRELRNIADRAAPGARIKHDVAPFHTRQIIEIEF